MCWTDRMNRGANRPIGTVIHMAKTANKTAPKSAQTAGETPVLSPETDALLSAVRTAVKAYDTKMKARDRATASALVAKVEACRTIITLMADPATFASRGPKAGKPSVTIIAELLGYPRQSFTPLFTGAEKLREYYATLPADVVSAIFSPAEGEAPTAPTEEETDLANVGLVSEADRARANRLKAKAAKTETPAPATGETDGETDGETETAVRTAETVIPTYDAVVAATLALQTVLRGYVKDAGFSAVQAENLQATLAEVSTLIESHRVDGGDV